MSAKQKIILSYFRDGKSQRQISRELQIGRRTVKKYIESYNACKRLQGSSKDAAVLSRSVVEPPKYDASNRRKRKLTEEIVAKIDDFLQSNDRKRQSGLHKQVMKKIDIHEALLAEGFQIGYTSVCNYISSKTNGSRKEAFIRQRYDPGRVLEFDWGETKLWIGGRMQRLYLAVFTPAYSNYRFSELYERQDTASFQQSHVNFFNHKKGVYGQIVYDNMRVAVRRFVGATEKEPTEALLQLSAYYHFDFRFCNAGKGNEKGHVERSVEYIRRKAFCLRDHFDNLEQANQWLADRCRELNEKHPQYQLMVEEKRYLHNLPAAPFDCCNVEHCRADKYSTVIVGSNRYSVPDHLVGKMLTVKIYPHYIECFHEKQIVAQHARSLNKHDWIIELDHYLNTLFKKPGALHSSVALERSNECVRNIYSQYFRESPREFIELLIYVQQNNLKADDLQKAINELLKMGCREVTSDKIITLCTRKQVAADALAADEISRQSKRQLLELSQLFSHHHTLKQN